MRDRKASIKSHRRLLANGGPKTVADIVRTAEKLYGDSIAFRELWGSEPAVYSYKRLARDIDSLGPALEQKGFGGKHIAILGENSYYWIVANLTAMLMGVAIPMDKELKPDTVELLLNRSHADAIICSENYREMALELSKKLEKPVQVICWGAKDSENLLTLESLLEHEGTGKFLSRTRDPEKLSAIIFTSGTTGANKGVMLSQKNICANVRSITMTIPVEGPSFSVLPMNHAFEFNCHVLPAIFFGVELYINSGLKYLMRNFKKYSPGMAVVVPLFVDEIYAGIIAQAKREGKYNKLMTAVTLSDGLRKVGIDLRRKIFREVLDNFGGELRLLVCGGAPINPVSAKGLESFGIDIIPGYGITECSPLVSADVARHPKMSAVGKAVAGVEIKIDSPDSSGEGEILVRGDNVALGYFEDDGGNSVYLPDGWFCTGDIGALDPSGRLYITGRKKNLIVLENGKNVHPEEIESAVLEEIDYIRELVVHEKTVTRGEKRTGCIAATISLKPDCPVAAMPMEERNAAVIADVKRVNKRLSSYKRISLVTVLLDEFEKTTTHKVIRDRAIKEDAYISI